MEKSTHGILIAMWVITRGFVSRKSHDIPKRYPQEIPIGSYRTYPYKKAPLKFDVQDLHRKDVKVGIDRGQLPVDALAPVETAGTGGSTGGSDKDSRMKQRGLELRNI